MEYLILALQSLLLFVLGVVGFDGVHYILHVWEHSRFPFLRWLGGLHAVHHEFLDKNMQIQAQYTGVNIFNHVIPEYATGTAGTLILAGITGWWTAGLLVFAVRTVMVVVYCVQKGHDFTHKPVTRINANRSLFFVGPGYHALHHVYVRQHYSSFVNVFDMIFGTNGQMRDRRFVVVGAASAFGEAVSAELRARGGLVKALEASSGEEILRDELRRADVMVLAQGVPSAKLIELFMEIGKQRLVPPEVWNLVSQARGKFYSTSPDIIYREKMRFPLKLNSAKMAAKISLFFISRGFCTVPVPKLSTR